MTTESYEFFGRPWSLVTNSATGEANLFRDNTKHLEHACAFMSETVISITELSESDLSITTNKNKYILCNAAFAPKNWVLIRDTNDMYKPATNNPISNSKCEESTHYHQFNPLSGLFYCPICDMHDESNKKVFTANCDHTWSQYLGMQESFTFCTKCDQKQV